MKFKNVMKLNLDLMALFSTDNLPKTRKSGVYVRNLDEFEDVGIHSVALFCRKICYICRKMMTQNKSIQEQ